MEYSGTQCLDYMSPTTSNRIKQILQREHHLKPTSTVKINIGFNGVKTIERLGGNKNIGKWVEDNNDFDGYMAELNKHRESINMEAIHGTGETDTQINSRGWSSDNTVVPTGTKPTEQMRATWTLTPDSPRRL